MKKFKFWFSFVILFSFLSLVIVLSGCSKTANVIDDSQTSDCTSICDNASNICPSLVDKNNCKSKCGDFAQDTKDHLKNSQSCEELSQKPDLIADLLIPTIDKPQEKAIINDCEAACNHYVLACLTLVPNATQSLFDDGYNSCLPECDKWDAKKVDCMINAFDCPAMTEQCGL